MIQRLTRSKISQQGGFFGESEEFSHADSNYGQAASARHFNTGQSTMADAGLRDLASYGMANPLMAAKEGVVYGASQMGAAAYSALPYVAGAGAALGAAAIISNAAADKLLESDNKRTNIEYKGPGSYQDDGTILYGNKANIAKRNYELQKDERRWHDVPKKTFIEEILVDRHIFIKSDLKKCLKNKETRSFQFLSYSKSFLLEAITDKEYEAAGVEIKNSSVDVAFSTSENLIKKSIEKSKLDNLFQKNLEDAKDALKKAGSN